MVTPFLPATNAQQELAVVALDEHGSAVVSFGDGGVARIPSGTGAVFLDDVALAPGPSESEYRSWSTGTGGHVVRLNDHGVADPTFGNDGMLLLPRMLGSTPVDWFPMAAGADGSLTVALHGSSASSGLVGAVRFGVDGRADRSFGLGDLTAFSLPAAPWPVTDLEVTGTGGVFETLGYDDNPGGAGVVLSLRPDGRLDPAFGFGGVATPFAGRSVDEVEVDPNGRPIFLGARDHQRSDRGRVLAPLSDRRRRGPVELNPRLNRVLSSVPEDSHSVLATRLSWAAASSRVGR